MHIAVHHACMHMHTQCTHTLHMHHACMHTHMPPHMYTHACTHMHAHIHMHKHMCTHIHTCTDMHALRRETPHTQARPVLPGPQTNANGEQKGRPVPATFMIWGLWPWREEASALAFHAANLSSTPTSQGPPSTAMSKPEHCQIWCPPPKTKRFLKPLGLMMEGKNLHTEHFTSLRLVYVLKM